MKIKEKKCRGQNKAFGFDGCGNLSKYRKYGLCPSCLSKWFNSTDIGREYLNNLTVKVSKPRLEFEKFSKEEKQRKGLPNLITNTRNAVHSYVKERDGKDNCISCGTPYKSNFQAGHYFKAELYSSLKFNFDNIHSQCFYCNNKLEGNLNAYAINLPKKIGKERFNELVKLSVLDKHQRFKWDREELNKIRKNALNKKKELKNENNNPKM